MTTIFNRCCTISKRTLRKDAEEVHQIHKRMPITITFRSAPEEEPTLRSSKRIPPRGELYAFAASQRHLSTLIIRSARIIDIRGSIVRSKILQSLERRLASGKRRDNRGGLFIDNDLTDDEIEGIDDLGNLSSDNIESSQTERIRTEINELREYAALARLDQSKVKATKLTEALGQVLKTS